MPEAVRGHAWRAHGEPRITARIGARNIPHTTARTTPRTTAAPHATTAPTQRRHLRPHAPHTRQRRRPRRRRHAHHRTQGSPMKTDAELKQDVISELEWDPSVNAAHVGVAVENGVVTLTGHLDTYAEKFAVERAVQRLHGVRAIALELDVRLSPQHQRSDADIAAAVEAALTWHSRLPGERIRVTVEKGWVTLGGDVDWEYQRRAAERVVRDITGVVGVRNELALRQRATPANLAQRIAQALARHAEREARHIEIAVEGDRVTLRGKVDSWAEREAAHGAAWSAPGVARVVDEIRVEP